MFLAMVHLDVGSVEAFIDGSASRFAHHSSQIWKESRILLECQSDAILQPL